MTYELLELRLHLLQRLAEVALREPDARDLEHDGGKGGRSHLAQEVRLVALPEERKRLQLQVGAQRTASGGDVHMLDAHTLVVG